MTLLAYYVAWYPDGRLTNCECNLKILTIDKDKLSVAIISIFFVNQIRSCFASCLIDHVHWSLHISYGHNNPLLCSDTRYFTWQWQRFHELSWPEGGKVMKLFQPHGSCIFCQSLHFLMHKVLNCLYVTWLCILYQMFPHLLFTLKSSLVANLL